ncbi:MAG: hypothetical protein IE916_01890 [Epsilonproteobacteria bacterium]|nr:hypothetical protein [Campylobacterota bacterium]
MDVSSSTNTTAGTLQIDAMKKAMNVQEQAIMKVLESSQQQSAQVAAQATGIGQKLDVSA